MAIPSPQVYATLMDTILASFLTSVGPECPFLTRFPKNRLRHLEGDGSVYPNWASQSSSIRTMEKRGPQAIIYDP